MNGEHTGANVTMWLLIAGGGWWKPSEIAEALGLDSSDRNFRGRLHQMTSDGMLSSRVVLKSQRTDPGDRMEYAVLPTCGIPRGLTCGQLSKALGIPEAA